VKGFVNRILVASFETKISVRCLLGRAEFNELSTGIHLSPVLRLAPVGQTRGGRATPEILLALWIFYASLTLYLICFQHVKFGFWRAPGKRVREKEAEDPYRGLRAGPVSFSLGYLPPEFDIHHPNSVDGGGVPAIPSK
jgi:hypothetical protein